MSSYNASGAPAKKRSPIVWIILGIIVLFVVPAVVCVGCCGGAAYFGMNQILNAPPYLTALERVKGNAEVEAKLGTPIETEGMPTLMTFNDAGGMADYRFKVKGPNGSVQTFPSTRSRKTGLGDTRISTSASPMDRASRF